MRGDSHDMCHFEYSEADWSENDYPSVSRTANGRPYSIYVIARVSQKPVAIPRIGEALWRLPRRLRLLAMTLLTVPRIYGKLQTIQYL